MIQQRLRITFVKGPELKYISHLDLALAWERALRRAEVPLAYSQGHNPHAKLQLASGLPLGYTGSAEVIDIALTKPMSPAEFSASVPPFLPKGLVICGVEEAPARSPSLQAALRQAEYRVTVETSLSMDRINRRISDLLAAGHLERERVRKGRKEVYDLRPLVDDVRLETYGGNHVGLWMRLSAGSKGNARPDAVLAALGLADAYSQVERTKLLFEFDSR